MSGGHFDYNQRKIKEIIESIEDIIQKETETRPPLIQELCINVYKILNEHSSQSTYYHFNTYEEAYDYFKKLGYEIEIISRELQKRKFRAKGIKFGEEELLEVREFIYEYYKNKNGEQVWYDDFSKETLDEFRKGLDILNKAYIYAQRIDWLLSGDDGEESFHKRLKEDLEEYYSNVKK